MGHGSANRLPGHPNIFRIWGFQAQIGNLTCSRSHDQEQPARSLNRVPRLLFHMLSPQPQWGAGCVHELAPWDLEGQEDLIKGRVVPASAARHHGRPQSWGRGAFPELGQEPGRRTSPAGGGAVPQRLKELQRDSVGLVLLHPSCCVASGKLLDLFVPQFPHL